MTEVHAPGAKIMIADGTISAIINCVALYAHGGVLYEVVWWQDGSRHSAWLNEQEMISEQSRVGIGFRTT